MKHPDPKILQNLKVQTEENPRIFLEHDVLAVDYGEKFCGLAWTQEGVVFPVGVFSNGEIISAVVKKSAEKSIKNILLGLPISNDGSENHVCAQIRELGVVLEKKGFFIEYVNERFSSQNTISPNKDDRIDDLAAAQILEFWLRQKMLEK